MIKFLRSTAASIGMLAYFALGFFFTAIIWGADELGVHWLLAGPVALLLAAIPIVGGTVAAYGLVSTFGWSWTTALMVTHGPAALLLGLACLVTIFTKGGRRR